MRASRGSRSEPVRAAYSTSLSVYLVFPLKEMPKTTVEMAKRRTSSQELHRQGKGGVLSSVALTVWPS